MVAEVRVHLMSRKLWPQADSRGRERWQVTKGEVGDPGDDLMVGTVVDSYRTKQ